MGIANVAVARPLGVVLMLVALFFVYRSFYGMRIGQVGDRSAAAQDNAHMAKVAAAE
jgi:hypothetical protein